MTHSPATPPGTPQFEAELTTIFRNAAIGIAVIDPDLRVLRANAALEKFLGYGAGELTGVAVPDFTVPEDRLGDRVHHVRLRTGEVNHYEIDKRYLRKDGRVVWGRLIASSVRDANGVHIYGVGMIEDINERRRVREQLDASLRQFEQVNQRLKLYLTRSPLACIVWGSDQIVNEWNPAAETMFGYTAEEAIGRNVYDLLSTPEGLVAVDAIRSRINAGEVINTGVIVENYRKDGSRVHCEWHFTVLGDESQATNGIVAFAIDLTARIRGEQERRMLEANLRHAQKLQSLGTLAGGIAHDFNNILLAISGNARLAMAEVPAEHPAQLSLTEVHKAAARASTIVNQILLFARREDESSLGPVNLRSLIEDSLSLLRATLPPRVAIVTDLPPGLPMVLGDSAQLHQVLLNLATNAAHAMGEPGGQLSIELRQHSVSGEGTPVAALHPGSYLRISVRDSGVGMSGSVAQRIFEPFFTTKPRGEGTGLGLSVVHGIVTAHGGAIVVDTSPGAGSTFHVYLPTLHQHLPVEPAPVSQPIAGEGQHILYVDDEDALVYLMTRVLKNLGYRVSAFTDPIEALAAMRAAPLSFDAVVTDLAMPGISGIQFTREVRAVRADVPIVMTSGYVRAEDRELARAAGVRELVLKPNTVDALGDVLHRLLKNDERPSG